MKITLKTTKEQDEKFKALTPEVMVQIIEDRTAMKHVPIEDLFGAMEESFECYKYMQEHKTQAQWLRILSTAFGISSVVLFILLLVN